MKTRYGVEEEIKTKEQDDYEENEDKEAQDLSNEEEKRHDEQMKKSKRRGRANDDDDDDKDEINIDTGEDEDKDKKEDAEDEDKLDLTDKQKEFLRDSKLAKQVRVLRAELKAMKSKIRRAEIEPIIQDILDAKSLVGKIDARSEYRKLSKLDISTLRELQAHYDTIKEAKTTPRYVVRNASLDSSDKSADNLLLSMRGDF